MRTDRTWRSNAFGALCVAAAALPFALHFFVFPAAVLIAAITGAAVFAAFTLADRAGA